jgi:Na+-transporting NADH:ubiquinone oxidoreductase subunit C
VKAVARERVRTVLFMVAVTFAVTAPLSAIQLLTAERVARNQRIFVQRVVLEAAAVEAPREDRAALALFGERVTENTATTYTVRDGAGVPRTDVYIRHGPGLWGRITAAVGVDRAAGTVTGVSFIEQNETPGLGARIEEPWFKRQFAGRTGPFRRVPEDQKDPAGGEINGITGATITTEAVRAIVEGVLKEAGAVAPEAASPPSAAGEGV